MQELQSILNFIQSVLWTSIIYTNFLKFILNMPIVYSDDKLTIGKQKMKKTYLNALDQLNKRLELNLISIYSFIKIRSYIHSRLLVLKCKAWK